MLALLGLLYCGPRATPGIEAEEYEVFSAVISSLYRDYYPEEQLLVLNATTDDPGGKYYRDEHTREVLNRLRPLLKTTTLKNYRTRNEQAYPLEARPDINRNYVLLSREDADAALTGSNGWVTVSRVGFDADRNQALLLVINSSGPLRGAGYFVLMVKKNGRWEIGRQETLFVS